MICRKLYHWMIGVVFAVLDVGRDEGLPSMSPAQVRQTVVGLGRRASANDRTLAEELLSTHAPPEPRQAILAHPSMDGTTWIRAHMLTPAMIRAWPVWERRHDDLAPVVCLATDLPPARTFAKVRPLRMAGMDDSGDGVLVVDSVAGTDRGLALPIYDRLHPNDWQFRCEGSTWRPFAVDWPAIDEVVTSVRPAIWAELDKS